MLEKKSNKTDLPTSPALTWPVFARKEGIGVAVFTTGGASIITIGEPILSSALPPSEFVAHLDTKTHLCARWAKQLGSKFSGSEGLGLVRWELENHGSDIFFPFTLLEELESGFCSSGCA
jgi:hypothetical protein